MRSVRKRAIIVAPFITAQPLRQFASWLDTSRNPEVQLLTEFNADSLIQGSVDAGAIAEFCRATPNTSVRHLPGLHAKVYVADNHAAIVTSGNLTRGGLRDNCEYGVYIDDPKMVRKIASDMRKHINRGEVWPLDKIQRCAEASESLRSKRATLESARASLRQQFENQFDQTDEARESLELRRNPGESLHSIFGRAVIHVLERNGTPMEAGEMSPLIQNLLPDLCDDSELTNDGREKKWLHDVRSARVTLQRRGLIAFDSQQGRWRLTDN